MEGESQIGKQGILQYTIYIYILCIHTYIHTLHYTALHCIALHYITSHYIHIYIYTHVCVCAIFAGYNLDFFCSGPGEASLPSAGGEVSATRWARFLPGLRDEALWLDGIYRHWDHWDHREMKMAIYSGFSH